MNKKDYLSVGLALFIVVVILSPVYLRTPHPIGYVESDSMAPTYQRGDLVVIYGKSPQKIKEREVILFKVPTVPDLVLHRVVDIIRQEGTLFFKTKGDNNPQPDPWLVSADQIFGVAIFRIPSLGFLFLWIPPVFFRIIGTIMGILLLLSLIKDLLKEKQEKEKHPKRVSRNKH